MNFYPSQSVVKRTFVWLICLVPFFYLTYGFANVWTAKRSNVAEIVFSWEHSIPFWQWMIIPYWSLNLLYGLTLLFQADTAKVNDLAYRYLTAQVIAVTCFLLFPLQASFDKPATYGIYKWLFDALGAFDQPYNQAPSLHIALLTIVWDSWRQNLKRWTKFICHIWAVLIALSVLTTYQHHFIDVPTGLALGLFCLWLYPQNDSKPFSKFRLQLNLRLRTIGLYYFLASSLCLLLCQLFFLKGAGLIFLWPCLAFWIVGTAYMGAGVKVFQKEPSGYVTLASRILLAPYRAFCRINQVLWTRHIAAATKIQNDLYLGRFPTKKEALQYTIIIDMTGEFIRPGKINMHWISIPTLDLAPVDKIALNKALTILEHYPKSAEQFPDKKCDEKKPRKTVFDKSNTKHAPYQSNGHSKTLLCCALGMQRSATVLMEWMKKQYPIKKTGELENELQKMRPVIFTQVLEKNETRWAARYCLCQAVLGLILLFIFDAITLPIHTLGVFFALFMTLATILICLHLIFDSHLFRKIANAETLATGMQDVDTFLQKWLHRNNTAGKDLLQRIKGTENIAKRLYFCLFIVCLIKALFLLLE